MDTYEITSELDIKELLRESDTKYRPRGKMKRFEEIPEKPSEEWADLAKDTDTNMGQAIRDRLRKLKHKSF